MKRNDQMFISIVGYGRMGRLMEETAIQKGISIVSTIDPSGSARYRSVTRENVSAAEVCVCFTQPHSVIDTVKELGALKKNIVMGTTGWYDHLDEVKRIVKDSKIGFVYSPNFALGVNLFFSIIEACAGIMDRFDDYDVAVQEVHHSAKLDSPSGTALQIAQIIVDNMRRKRRHRSDLETALKRDEVHISSTRCGHVPGQHAVLFDSEVDTIQLVHTARSRKGFAVGALVAANWILGKRGFFTKENVVADLLKR